MRAQDLRPCDGCGGLLISPAKGIATFFVVHTSIAMPDRVALQQLAGLTTFFVGHATLAEAFVGDQDVVKVFGELDPELWEKLLVCFGCYTGKTLAAISEEARYRREAAAGAKAPDPSEPAA